jgi:glycosyltransferase involved in cell wall biosynthesis
METESGGGFVTFERVRELERHHKVTILTLYADNAAREHFSRVTWHVAGARRPRNSYTLLQSYLKRLPLSVWRNTTRDGLHTANALNCNHWDMVYVDHWLMIETALQVRSKKRILHLHNAEPEVFFRAAQFARVPGKLVMWNEGRRSATYLRWNIARFDGLHLLSKDDAEALKARKISHPNTRVFLPTAAPPIKRAAQFEDRQNEALFIGTLSWHPNEEGLTWYVKNVLPETSPDIHHQVVGGGASDNLRTILGAPAGPTAHGYVDDIEPFYQSAKCLVAPLLSGSGIKIKIVNALARGLPVVTTPIGIEGFPPGFESAIAVAETPAAFAREIEKLCHDREAWQQASKRAYSYFKAHFFGLEWQKWAEELYP